MIGDKIDRIDRKFPDPMTIRAWFGAPWISAWRNLRMRKREASES